MLPFISQNPELSAELGLRLRGVRHPVPARALRAPSSALAYRPGPGCHRSHLLPAGFVEVLATEVRGDEVATEGGDEGDCGHKSQQRADQIHQ